MRWKGPLSLSISFNSGDYHNTEVEKGVCDDIVIESLNECEEVTLAIRAF